MARRLLVCAYCLSLALAAAPPRAGAAAPDQEARDLCRAAWREAAEHGSVTKRTVQRLRASRTMLVEEQARSAAEPAVAVRVAFGLALAGVEPATNTGRAMAPYFRWRRNPAAGMSLDVEDAPLLLLALYRQDGTPSTVERMLAMRGDGALAQNRDMALARRCCTSLCQCCGRRPSARPGNARWRTRCGGSARATPRRKPGAPGRFAARPPRRGT